MYEKMDSKENDMEAANHRLQEAITEEPTKKRNTWKTTSVSSAKPAPQNPLIPPIVFFYEEIKLIPNSSAKEPWLLKKYLNCCKFAYQRLKGELFVCFIATVTLSVKRFRCKY